MLDADKAERAQLDVMDNAFRAHATHKEHFEGFRSDYRDHTWELRVKVQVPTRQKGPKLITTLYQVSDVLLKVEGQVMTFSLPETIVIQKDQERVEHSPQEGGTDAVRLDRNSGFVQGQQSIILRRAGRNSGQGTSQNSA